MKSCNLIHGVPTGQFGYRLECGKYAHSSCPGPNECTEKNGPFTVKICTNTKCKRELPATAEYFYCRSSTKDGLQHKCKRCAAEYCKKYYETGIGKNVIKRYQQTNKYKQYRKNYATTVGCHLRNIFSCMKRRCEVPDDRAYKWYGDRGIKVCFKSANEFVNYVMNVLQIDPRKLTIDRIDNNGNYEPGNIRFVTHQENMQNTSRAAK